MTAQLAGELVAWAAGSGLLIGLVAVLTKPRA